jgi:hypothetical protein
VLGASTVEAHLSGALTLALSAASSDSRGKLWAHFAAFDVDARFPERLRILNEIISDLGLATAAFATGGSKPDKGKVVITLRKNVPVEAARALLVRILEGAYEDCPELFSTTGPGDLELYPTQGGGGLLRILGRNGFRQGNLESATSLNALPLSLGDVIPLSVARLNKLVPVSAVQQGFYPRWVDSLCEAPWKWSLKREGITGRLFRLASFCKTMNRTEREYELLLSRIIEVSPDLDRLSPTTKDRRNPVCRELRDKAVWKKARATWVPTTTDNRAYRALVEKVRSMGLRPHCFFATQRELAHFAGVLPNAIQKQLALAERKRLVVVHDYGSSNTTTTDGGGKVLNVSPGSAALYGLVGEGETVYDVIRDAKVDDLMAERELCCVSPEAIYFVCDAIYLMASAKLSQTNQGEEIAA